MRKFIKFGCLLIVLIFVAPFVFMVIRVALMDDAERAELRSKNPGSAAFQEINSSITAYKGSDALGNSDEAIAIGNTFSLVMKDIREEAFSKGKKSALSLSDGHFVTYCHSDEQSLMLFCHVPQLRKFNEEAKASLMSIAWSVAQRTAEDKNMTDKQLVVGLRGTILYYELWFGGLKGPPKAKRSNSDGKKYIYELLTPKKVAPTTEPKKIEAQPTTTTEEKNTKEATTPETVSEKAPTPDSPDIETPADPAAENKVPLEEPAAPKP